MSCSVLWVKGRASKVSCPRPAPAGFLVLGHQETIMNAMRKQAVPAAGLFHPIEHAILADYLGVKPPKYARCINHS